MINIMQDVYFSSIELTKLLPASRAGEQLAETVMGIMGIETY